MIVLVKGELLLEKWVQSSLIGQCCFRLRETFPILDQIQLDVGHLIKRGNEKVSENASNAFHGGDERERERERTFNLRGKILLVLAWRFRARITSISKLPRLSHKLN